MSSLQNSIVCSICLGSTGHGSLFTTECGHVFHYSCLVNNATYGNGKKCPNCRTIISDDILHPTSHHLSSNRPPPHPFTFSPVISGESNNFDADSDDCDFVKLPQTVVGELDISCIPEYESCESDNLGKLSCLTRLKTPQGTTKIGVDIVAVLDVSGSMIGEKLQLMKDSMKYLVEQLTSNDQLAIVEFSYTARKLSPLVPLTPDNKQTVILKIDEMNIDGSTNISSGLERGWHILQNRHVKNPISAIFLLTDGCDDTGSAINSILRTKINAIKEQLQEPINIFCFGYGNDHDALTLGTISDAGDGLFYYVGEIDRLHEAFGKCIGGLVTTIARNISISITSSVPICSTEKYSERINEKKIKFNIPNSYEGEIKEFVIDLIPTSVPIDLSLSCSYKDVQTQVVHTVASSLMINDGARTNPNIDIDKQRNRLIASNAMTEAQGYGDTGRYELAKGVLDTAISTIQTSPSSIDVFCIALTQDLLLLKARLGNRFEYENGGRHQFISSIQSHTNQRSNAINSELYSTPSQINTQSTASLYRSRSNAVKSYKKRRQ